MPRTDAHRPSAINPDDYTFVACDYFGAWAHLMFETERKLLRAHIARTGGRFANHSHGGTCHICGAAAMYVARYHHVPSNTYITTGMDCAEKMAIGQPGIFKAFRAKVSHERKISKGKAVAREVLALLGMSPAWPIYDLGFGGDVDENFNPVNPAEWGREEPIIQSIVYKLVRYGTMSEKQATLIAKLLADIADRPRRLAEQQAKRAAEAAASDYVGTVGERLTLDLTVVFIASFETQFGTCHVHSMRDAAGNVVVYKGNRIAEKDQSLRLKATVREHAVYKDVKQTVVSRPKVEA